MLEHLNSVLSFFATLKMTLPEKVNSFQKKAKDKSDASINFFLNMKFISKTQNLSDKFDSLRSCPILILTSS